MSKNADISDKINKKVLQKFEEYGILCKVVKNEERMSL